MKLLILFQDNPDIDPNIRTIHMKSHLEFLCSHSNVVLAAGPVHKIDGCPNGGLWLVEVDTIAEAEALVRADPFWPSGLRKSYEFRKWTQVFADGEPKILPE